MLLTTLVIGCGNDSLNQTYNIVIVDFLFTVRLQLIFKIYGFFITAVTAAGGRRVLSLYVQVPSSIYFVFFLGNAVGIRWIVGILGKSF